MVLNEENCNGKCITFGEMVISGNGNLCTQNFFYDQILIHMGMTCCNLWKFTLQIHRLVPTTKRAVGSYPFWKHSHLKSSLLPAIKSNESEKNTGVLWIKDLIRSRASLMEERSAAYWLVSRSLFISMSHWYYSSKYIYMKMQVLGVKHVSDRIRCLKMKVIQIWACKKKTFYIKQTLLPIY